MTVVDIEQDDPRRREHERMFATLDSWVAAPGDYAIISSSLAILLYVQQQLRRRANGSVRGTTWLFESGARLFLMLDTGECEHLRGMRFKASMFLPGPGGLSRGCEAIARRASDTIHYGYV